MSALSLCIFFLILLFLDKDVELIYICIQIHHVPFQQNKKDYVVEGQS